MTKHVEDYHAESRVLDRLIAECEAVEGPQCVENLWRIVGDWLRYKREALQPPPVETPSPPVEPARPSIWDLAEKAQAEVDKWPEWRRRAADTALVTRPEVVRNATRPKVAQDSTQASTLTALLCNDTSRWALTMFDQLQQNSHKGRSWFYDSPRELMKRVHEEVGELNLAVAQKRLQDIPKEAADVANMAMMVADAVKGPGVW